MVEYTELQLTPEWAIAALKELSTAEGNPSHWGLYFYVVNDGWQKIPLQTVEELREAGRIVISYKGMFSLSKGVPPRSECLYAWQKLAEKYIAPGKRFGLLPSPPVEPHWDRWNRDWIEHDDLLPPTRDNYRWITRTFLETLIQGKAVDFVMPEF